MNVSMVDGHIDNGRMTAEEVKNKLALYMFCKARGNGKLYINGVEKVIFDALEKQIPKKPIKQIWVDDEKRKSDVRLATKDDVLTKDNHCIINLCPNCKEWVMRYKDLRPPNDKDYYCKHCGQALDWSEEE